MCLNHFICSGRAYETIGIPLPSPLLIQMLTVGGKLGSLLGYKPYHYAVVAIGNPLLSPLLTQTQILTVS
jgi:hypothetical protein